MCSREVGESDDRLFQNKKKIIGLILVAFTLCVIFSSPFQEYASIPNEIRVFEGKASSLNFTLPAQGSIVSSDPEVVNVSSNDEATDSPLLLQALGSGTTDLHVKVGNIPVKRVKVSVLPDVEVYPGGQSIGVQLNSAGPLVVGHHFIDTDDGKLSPAEEANIRVGDMIIKMNDIQIKSLDQISDIVDDAGKNDKPLKLELLRGKDKVHVELNPVYDDKEDRYRLGLYIRHSAAGVGTLTFIHPESGAYGALGHVISDMDTQKPIIVGEGNILESNVSSIEKGVRGGPGEKLSRIDQHKVLGNVKRNTPFGIFGEIDEDLKHNLKNGIIDEPIPIGLSEEVEKGPAQILTVVEGKKVEKFDIEVVDMVEQKFPATKGLVIKVTDERLLEKTGGIVQGMSGSPIIQNGKLIGAVTHVFVNDPTSGYGCFIEWMLQDAGLNIQPEKKPKAS